MNNHIEDDFRVRMDGATRIKLREFRENIKNRKIPPNMRDHYRKKIEEITREHDRITIKRQGKK